MEWRKRTEFVPGQPNVKAIPLVPAEKVLLPPLHIKLGLMKNFVKALPKEGDGFKYLVNKFPAVSDAKLLAGVFVGPQIRELLKDACFKAALNPQEEEAWESFREVVTGFLGNTKADNYKDRVQRLLKGFEKIGARMSIKMHFLHAHLEYFPQNLEITVRNKVKYFTRTFQKWNTGIKEDGA